MIWARLVTVIVTGQLPEEIKYIKNELKNSIPFDRLYSQILFEITLGAVCVTVNFCLSREGPTMAIWTEGDFDGVSFLFSFCVKKGLTEFTASNHMGQFPLKYLGFHFGKQSFSPARAVQ